MTAPDLSREIDTAAIMAEHRNALKSPKRAICESCVKPWPCDTYLLAEAYEGYPELTDRLSQLLRGVADALKGPPPELTTWGWHDLPERAAETAAALVEERAKVQAGPVAEIVAQRARNHERWGDMSIECRPPDYAGWLPTLGEEFGEVCETLVAEGDRSLLRAELIDLASVALMWIDSIDRAALGGSGG